MLKYLQHGCRLTRAAWEQKECQGRRQHNWLWAACMAASAGGTECCESLHKGESSPVGSAERACTPCCA